MEVSEKQRNEELLAKLKKLYDEYDVGGFVNVVSPDSGEVMLICPKWSGVELQSGRGPLQFQVKVNLSEPGQAFKTAHFIEAFRNVAALLLANGDALFKGLEEEGAEVISHPLGAS